MIPGKTKFFAFFKVKHDLEIEFCEDGKSLSFDGFCLEKNILKSTLNNYALNYRVSFDPIDITITDLKQKNIHVINSWARNSFDYNQIKIAKKNITIRGKHASFELMNTFITSFSLTQDRLNFTLSADNVIML